MVMKDAFAILRADKQLQRSIHDFALCFQAREFFRLADQGFVNVDVSATHKLIIHQFERDWCIHAEELLITVPDEPVPCCFHTLADREAQRMKPELANVKACVWCYKEDAIVRDSGP